MAITKKLITAGLKSYVNKSKDVRLSVNEEDKLVIKLVDGHAQKVDLKIELFTKEKLAAIQKRAKSGSELHRIIFLAIVGVVDYIKLQKKTKVKAKKKPVAKTGKVVFEFPKLKKGPKDLVYSYSKRNTFFDCPKDYFYSYLMKMNKDTYGIQAKKQKSAFFIGGVFHDLLEIYYVSLQIGFSTSQAYEIAKTDFDANWDDNKKQELEGITYQAGKIQRNYLMDLNEAEAYFDHYYSYYKNDDFDEVIYCEVDFLSELYKYDDKDLEGYHFYQHIKADMLVKDKGVYKLIEHKTHGSDRTREQRISPQTLEYVEGIQNELGIKIDFIVFNEVRKALPKGFTLLKSGKVSTAATKLTNFSRTALDKQLENGDITPEDYQEGLKCINMNYYFHREEIRVSELAQRRFSLQMELATKNLARSMVYEKQMMDAGKEIDVNRYPIIWSSNRRYGSPFQELHIAELTGFDDDAMADLLFDQFQPKDLSYQNAPTESTIDKVNRLAAFI